MCTSLAEPSTASATTSRYEALFIQYMSESAHGTILGAMLEKSPAAQAILQEFSSETMPALGKYLRSSTLTPAHIDAWGRLLVLISLFKRPGKGAPSEGGHSFYDYVMWAKEF